MTAQSKSPWAAEEVMRAPPGRRFTGPPEVQMRKYFVLGLIVIMAAAVIGDNFYWAFPNLYTIRAPVSP